LVGKKKLGPDHKEDLLVISRFAKGYERKANLITREAKMYEVCDACRKRPMTTFCHRSRYPICVKKAGVAKRSI